MPAVGRRRLETVNTTDPTPTRKRATCTKMSHVFVARLCTGGSFATPIGGRQVPVGQA